MKKIIDVLKQKYPNLESLLQLGSDLSGTLFNTVLLELYKKQAAKVKVADLDGGLVDWTQKLIPNKKHRLFISGCGIELVHKIWSNV